MASERGREYENFMRGSRRNRGGCDRGSGYRVANRERDYLASRAERCLTDGLSAVAEYIDFAAATNKKAAEILGGVISPTRIRT
jgi:hypothetical protein